MKIIEITVNDKMGIVPKDMFSMLAAKKTRILQALKN